MPKPQLTERDQWQVLKEDGRIGVYQASLQNGQAVIIKEYRLRHVLDRWSFARKQQRVDELYRELGSDNLGSDNCRLPPLKFSERRKSLGRFCYDCISGRDFRQVDWRNATSAQTGALMEMAAGLIGGLHQGSWVHGDFKFGNLLYSEGQQAIYLLDVEDVRASQSPVKRARDIARFLLNGLELAVPVTGLEQFWNTYCEINPEPELEKSVQKWLGILSKRHRQKYKRTVDVAQLAFLNVKLKS